MDSSPQKGKIYAAMEVSIFIEENLNLKNATL